MDVLDQFNSAEKKRYHRQMNLKEIGPEGQLKLKQAKVLLIGSGGLGSPLALYLAASGVGKLGIVDGDSVDESNLHRQILFTAQDVGKKKVDIALEKLKNLNPHIEIETFSEFIHVENCERVFKGYDLILDGSDNFPTRYLVNDACFLLKKKLIHGSVSKFSGQLAYFNPSENGPCYRCLFPEIPPPGAIENCGEGGVLGIMPGVIGTLQGLMALNILLGKENSYSSKVFLFNGSEINLQEFTLKKDPTCELCGKNPKIQELAMEKDQSCSLGFQELSVMDFKAEWKDKGRDFLLIDVREDQEREYSHIGGVHIPLSNFPSLIADYQKELAERPVIIYCHHGMRSQTACNFVSELNAPQVFNLTGGIDAYSLYIDSTVPRY